MVQSRRINTGIGVGDAQILQSNDNTDDFGRLGAAAGYNSDGAKLRRVKKKADEITSGLDDFKTDDWTMFQQEKFNQALSQARETIQSREFQKNPNWQAKAEEIVLGIKSLETMNTNAAKMGSKVYNAFMKEDPAMLKGKDDLDLMWNADYEIPDVNDPAEALKEYNAIMQVNASNVEKVVEHDWEMKDYGTVERTYEANPKNGRQFSSIRKELTPEAKAGLVSDAKSMMISGLKQIAGVQGVIKNPSDVTYANDVSDWAKENHAATLNEFDSEEEKNKYLTEVLSPMYLEQEFKKKLSEKTKDEYVKPDKDKSGFPDPSEVRFTREKSPVTVEGDVEMGATTHPMGNAPKREKVNVTDTVKDENGKITNYDVVGETVKFGIKGGERVVYVSYKTKGSGEEGAPTSTAKVVEVPFEEIEGSISAESANWYDSVFNRMRKEGVTEEQQGWTKENVEKRQDLIEKSESKYIGYLDEELQSDLTEIFGDRVKNIKDPTGTANVKFTLDGTNYQFDWDEEEERTKYWNLLKSKAPEGEGSGTNQYGI